MNLLKMAKQIIIAKFGGGILKDAESISRLPKIIRQEYSGKDLAIVISALNKTTNRLEELLKIAYQKPEKSDPAFSHRIKLDELKNYYLNLIDSLFSKNNKESVQTEVRNVLTQINQYLSNKSGQYDFDYDQIISLGEVLASLIIHHYLSIIGGIANRWLDARQYIITDDNWRKAEVNLKRTKKLLQPSLTSNHFKICPIVILQGFIGFTSNRNLAATTTLGRESSDYTAGILGRILKAERVDLWKDVDGIYSTDPKNKGVKVKKFEEMSFEELEELSANLGSLKIVHKKTLSILKGLSGQKRIPLYVRSFKEPEQKTIVR